MGSARTTEKIRHRVQEVIEELGLLTCAETKIGGIFQRGLSGGEKKRVSIAVELLKDESSILFLDEPSSGLDSATAFHMLYLLRKLATTKNRTIVCTIHQPHSKIYKLFDKILLLSHGRCVYMGAASNALEHFTILGFPAKAHTNPSDHMLDICSIDGRSFEAEVRSYKRVNTMANAYFESPLRVQNDAEADRLYRDNLLEDQSWILNSSRRRKRWRVFAEWSRFLALCSRNFLNQCVLEEGISFTFV